MPAMIHLTEICKTYRSGSRDRQVLDSLELTVAAGELVALLGRSGSGKTTLLNIIAGLESDFDGVAEVNGQRLDRLDDRHLSRYRSTTVGLVPQGFHLLDHLSCRDNVALPSLFASGAVITDRRQADCRARDLLAEVGLAELADARPATLSGGEQQRVAIARALFHHPRVLLCDEVTGNLDGETAGAMIGLLQDLNQRHGVTMVLVTHDPVVCRACHRSLVLEAGTLAPVAGAGAP